MRGAERGVAGTLSGTRRGPIWGILHRDRPGFGLPFVTDRTIGMAQPDVARPEVVPLKKGRHRQPLRRWRSALCDVFTDATHGQRGNGRHCGSLLKTTPTVEVFSRSSN